MASHFKCCRIHLCVEQVLWDCASCLGPWVVVREQEKPLPTIHNQYIVRNICLLQVQDWFKSKLVELSLGGQCKPMLLPRDHIRQPMVVYGFDCQIPPCCQKRYLLCNAQLKLWSVRPMLSHDLADLTNKPTVSRQRMEVDSVFLAVVVSWSLWSVFKKSKMASRVPEVAHRLHQQVWPWHPEIHQPQKQDIWQGTLKEALLPHPCALQKICPTPWWEHAPLQMVLPGSRPAQCCPFSRWAWLMESLCSFPRLADFVKCQELHAKTKNFHAKTSKLIHMLLLEASCLKGTCCLALLTKSLIRLDWTIKDLYTFCQVTFPKSCHAEICTL